MLWLLWLACVADPEVPPYQITIEADPTVTLRSAQFVDRCLCKDYHLSVAIRHYEPTKGPSRTYAEAWVPIDGTVEVTNRRILMSSPPRQRSDPFGWMHRGHDWSCTPEVAVDMHTAAFPTWKVSATGAVPSGASTLRAEDMHFWNAPAIAVPPLRATPLEIQRFATGALSQEGDALYFTRRGGHRQRVLYATPALAALVGPVEGHLLPARDGVVADWLRTPSGGPAVQMYFGPLPPGLTVENPEAAPTDASEPVIYAKLSDETGRETTWIAPYAPGAGQ